MTDKIARDWDSWSKRRGWPATAYDGPRHWTRPMFREALKVLPQDHPNRWAFKYGSYFSFNYSESRWQATWIMFVGFMWMAYASLATMAFVFHSVGLGMVGIAGLAFGLHRLYYFLRYSKR